MKTVVKNVKSNNEILKEIRENLDKCLNDISDIKSYIKDIKKDIEAEEVVEDSQLVDTNPSMNGINETASSWWFMK